MSADPVKLIVNADDYGYFASVSQGILAGAGAGRISATGILANAERFDERMAWLRDCPQLDPGVHLNVTWGVPLSAAMRKLVDRWGGRWPGKMPVVLGVLRGAIPVGAVVGEWRAQIQRCLDAGLNIMFLNSHEHVHMLPSLYPQAQALADEFGIRHLRYTQIEWAGKFSPGALVRNTLLGGMNVMNRKRRRGPASRFLGLAESGNVTVRYLQTRLAGLPPGTVCELMCHPGYFDADEIHAPALRAYHHWQSELDMLTGPDFGQLLKDYNVTVTGYRNLQ